MLPQLAPAGHLGQTPLLLTVPLKHSTYALQLSGSLYRRSALPAQGVFPDMAPTPLAKSQRTACTSICTDLLDKQQFCARATLR